MTFDVANVADSINYLSYMMRCHKRLFYTRYGDGEMMLMTGDYDGRHTSSPELARDIKKSFLIDDDRFIKAASIGYPFEEGMKPGMFIEGSVDGGSYNKLLVEKAESITSQEKFYSPIVFHYLSVFNPGMLNDFLNMFIRNKKVLFVGTRSKDEVERIFGEIDFYVSTPPENAYYSIDEWWPEVEKKVKECDVVILAAGAASKVTACRLWEMEIDIHCIDIGSVVDAFGDDMSRTWIRLAGADNIRNNIDPMPNLKNAASIDIRIPYSMTGNIGEEYNKIMDQSSGWTLFLDSDILLLSRNWYRACLSAIDKYGEKAGWITCCTNAISCPDQRAESCVLSTDIIMHIETANNLWNKFGDRTFKSNPDSPFSGFFILTNKKAWEDVGGFKDGFFGVDNDYYDKLIAKGYDTYVMPGVYSYHLYGTKRLMV